MRQPSDTPIALKPGKTMAFYAPAGVAEAIENYLRDHRGGRHGEASKWFVEAAQRDLRARGVNDGSLPTNEREELVRDFAALAASTPVEQLREELNKMRLGLAEATGAPLAAGGA
jgi:hypothetical protein